MFTGIALALATVAFISMLIQMIAMGHAYMLDGLCVWVCVYECMRINICLFVQTHIAQPFRKRKHRLFNRNSTKQWDLGFSSRDSQNTELGGRHHCHLQLLVRLNQITIITNKTPELLSLFGVPFAHRSLFRLTTMCYRESARWLQFEEQHLDCSKLIVCGSLCLCISWCLCVCVDVYMCVCV